MNESVRLIRDLVSIPSPTGDTGEAMKFLNNWCSARGIPFREEKGVILIGSEDYDILLIGHIDTVPGHIPVRIEDGILWGRGSVDAKGPFCSALMAIHELPEIRDRVLLVGVPDEEGSSESAIRLRDTIKERPCIILEPSGWNGITISYNGRLLLEISTMADPAHSGHESPFSAEIMVDIINTLRGSNNPRIILINGDMTATFARLDIRYPFGRRPILPGSDNIGIKILEELPPVRSEKNNPLVRSFLRSIRRFGGNPSFKRKTGTCDMNIFGEKWSAPIIAYGPGDGRLDHTDGERISVEEYMRGIQVLKGALKDFLN